MNGKLAQSVTIFLAVLSALSCGSLFAQQCAWDPDSVQTGTGTLDAFTDSDCFVWDDASSVHLESDGCKCSAWARLRGSRTNCGVGANCTERSSNSAMISFPGLGGPSSLPMGPYNIERTTSVQCGGSISMGVSSSCSCVENVPVSTTTYHQKLDTVTGQWVTVATTVVTHQHVVHCSGGGSNLTIKGVCSAECDTHDPPDDIVVD